MMAATEDELSSLFISVGLSQQKAKETLKNDSVSSFFRDTILEAKKYCNSHIHKSMGILLYHVATKLKAQCHHQMPLLVQYISNGKINNEMQLNAALAYLLHHPTESVNIEEFEKKCGIGVIITADCVAKKVGDVIEKQRDTILEQRYQFNSGKIMGEVRQALVWADGKVIKEEVEKQLVHLLGPKTEDDLHGNKKKAQVTAAVRTVKESKESAPAQCEHGDGAGENGVGGEGSQSVGELMMCMNFHAPGENYKTDQYVITANTMDLLQQHVTRTQGKVQTRFPPEPNGILHIGHAKAININFGYAKAAGGVCYLRYDDTNPEKEEERFFTGIKDIVGWLGFSPDRITHSSDYFPQLYELAIELIKCGAGYVCHQRAEEIKGHQPPPSPWRDRPVCESLALFQDMKRGKIDEGQATLRMKMTLEEGKQDPVAYRIKFTHHHRTGDKWCIYPTYDYTHCLCDSLEDITHSLCTKEFQNRRSSYYWLCNVLGLYCPVQWEYGRLNVNYTVVSKRKIDRLIELGIVSDWDDPRLFTLSALRRRGFPPEAINKFVSSLGVTGALMSVDPVVLDAACRDVLNSTASRHMVVLEPLLVTLTTLPPHTPTTLTVPDFPQDPGRGQHNIQLSSSIFIDRSDFKEEGDKNYRRLSPGQAVGLKYANLVISVRDVIKNASGDVVEVEVEACDVNQCAKPKAFIHWVSRPVSCTVRLYESLFKHKNPEDVEEVPGGFVSDCNKDSLTTISDALIDASLRSAQVYDKFQFERVGFFSVDPDSTRDKLVFNRTVHLKDSSGKT